MEDERDPGPLFDSDPRGVGIDRLRPVEAINQAFSPGPIPFGPSADDGMPAPSIQGNLPLAPALSPKTMVCMADTSEFVIRSKRWGGVVARFKPSVVERAENGDYYVDVPTAIGCSTPWRVIVRMVDWRTGRVPVEPVRPQCKNLARQMTDFQDLGDHQFVERLCVARRDSDSFFLSVRDGQYHACELRSPADPVGVVLLDRFDALKIKQGADRLKSDGDAPGFDVDAALASQEHQAGQGAAGSSIFSSKKE